MLRKHQSIDDRLQKKIDVVKDEIVREESPVAVVISGSVARGNYGSHADVDLYILVDDGSEKSFTTRIIDGRRFELSYYPIQMLKNEIREKIDTPRALNAFHEAKILFDPYGVAKECVELTRRRYQTFRYPPEKLDGMIYGVVRIREKMLDALEDSDQLYLMYEVFTVVNYVTQGLLYLHNIPQLDYRGNLQLVLSNDNIDDRLKQLLRDSLLEAPEKRVKASLDLCDLFLDTAKSTER